ncbi:MAG: hypothetical protein DRJ14_06475 [Acidobacteria bacterium]|nr:MAG: hypothetical protein DRJ14_06475 [Acidobacteriota bacterium]
MEAIMYLGKGKFPPVKFFISVIYHDSGDLDAVVAAVRESIGEISTPSESFPFDFTDYYEPEMGSPLFRIFLPLKKTGPADGILPIKKACLELEARFSEKNRRKVNLDPGYIDLYKLVLVSEKYLGHKIYIGEGICADMVLLLGKKQVTPFRWTFPDFKSGNYDNYILELRKNYLQQLKNEGILPGPKA